MPSTINTKFDNNYLVSVLIRPISYDVKENLSGTREINGARAKRYVLKISYEFQNHV